VARSVRKVWEHPTEVNPARAMTLVESGARGSTDDHSRASYLNLIAGWFVCFHLTPVLR
jgi:hypothetical protein